MNKNWIRRSIILLVFLLSFFGFLIGMNQGNTDMTIEMPQASLPVAYITINDQKINEMHGYSQRMDTATLRDQLTPIGEDREVSFWIDLYEQQLEGVRFEVRSIGGTRLIEDTRVTDYYKDGDVIKATVNLKDLIDKNVEYNWILILSLKDGREVYYYTRVIQCDNSLTEEKIAYVLDFHQKTFDKEAAKEISMYLESNSEGDNSNFGKVDIHSSLQQVSWGELKVRRLTEPSVSICELGNSTASIKLQTIVEIPNGKVRNRYRVQEFYRIRYTADRVYLLNFERTMEEIFVMEKTSFANNKILLGIQKEDAMLEESDGGNILAFTNAGRIYSYNTDENKLAQLFGFMDEDNFDVRTYYDFFDVKILDVEENGNVSFMVYGYMNRGVHEGEVGIEVCYYDSLSNTVEEQIFINYDKSPQILIADLKKFAYVNKNNELFSLVDGSIYRIDIKGKSAEVIVSGLHEDNFYVSEAADMVVWQEQEDTLILMNLNSEERFEITVGAEESCRVIGFMNEDVVYGVAYKQDVSKDLLGTVVFPMKKLLIQAENGTVLKTYENEDIYVMDGEIYENQLNLIRAKGIREDIQKEDANEETIRKTTSLGTLKELIPIEDDQITSNAETLEGTNKLTAVVTDLYLTISQIELKNEIDTKSIKFLTPKEVLYEGGRSLSLEDEEIEERYIVYVGGRAKEIYKDASKAVSYAYANVGTVVDYYGNEIYKRGETVERNQIMAIEEAQITDEKNSLTVCLDTILQFEGISRNTEFLLQQGQNTCEILEHNLKDYEILNLTGCPMDVALYYLNQDIPVLARQGEDSYVLLIGFNQQNVVLFDPEIGRIFKSGMNDTREMFAENGNCFVAYARAGKTE